MIALVHSCWFVHSSDYWLLFFKPEIERQMAAQDTLPLSRILFQLSHEPWNPATSVLTRFGYQTPFQLCFGFQLIVILKLTKRNDQKYFSGIHTANSYSSTDELPTTQTKLQDGRQSVLVWAVQIRQVTLMGKFFPLAPPHPTSSSHALRRYGCCSMLLHWASPLAYPK